MSLPPRHDAVMTREQQKYEARIHALDVRLSHQANLLSDQADELERLRAAGARILTDQECETAARALHNYAHIVSRNLGSGSASVRELDALIRKLRQGA